MKLWSFQYEEVWDAIQKEGFHRVKDDFVDKDFAVKYKWLVAQMHKKVGPPPEGVTYPIWAYARRNGVDGKRPDLRHNEYGKKGDKLVLLELDIPEERLCLSDLDAWNIVLLDGYCCYEDDSEDKWNRRRKWLNSLPEVARSLAIKSSWHEIFNIAKEPFDNGFISYGNWLQATFWEIRKEDVVSVKHFTAK